MDEEVIKALKKIIKDEIGDLVHDEIKLQFEPLQKAIDSIRKENRDSYDNISSQITEDRKDINKIKVDIAKSTEQNKVIIDNQNHQEEAVVTAVKEEAQKIPAHTEKAVKQMFDKKPFLTKIREKFGKKGSK